MSKKAPAKNSTRSNQSKVNMGSKKPSATNKGPSLFRRILTSKWTLRLLLFVALFAVIAWQWSNITRFFSNLVHGTYELLGWGFILILLVIVGLIAVIFRGRLAAFARHYKLHLWHVLVGAIALFFAVWGILALCSLGGEVGQAIISQSRVAGILRVIGLVVLGIIFIAPGASFRAIRALGRFIAGLFRRSPSEPHPGNTPASPYMPRPTQAIPPAATTPIAPAHHEGGTITGAPPAEKKSWFAPPKKSEPANERVVPITPTPTPAPAPVYKEVFPVRNQVPTEAPKTEAKAAENPPQTPEAPAYKEVFPVRHQAPMEAPPHPTKAAESTPTAPAAPVYKEVFPVLPALSQAPAAITHSDTKTAESTSQQVLDKQIAQNIWQRYGSPFPPTVIDGWKMPTIDILDKVKEVEFNDADNAQRAQVIEEALASYGVSGKVIQINVGPTVTQFGIEPGWDIKTKRIAEKDQDGNTVFREEEVMRTRVKVERITSLANDLALALAAPTLRIEAPVPGKSIVGVEVPNRVYSTVSLRSVIETNTFQKILSKSKLAMALGKGAGGEEVSSDLAKMPHLLIAGATGSGKTVCLNAVICCLLVNNSPFDTKFVMIDPKRVELTPFNSLPHLVAPVIVDTDKALSAMRWLNAEMDNRYKTLAGAGARNIEGFNREKVGAEKMPNIVLIIDELADLMMAGFDEVEHILCRLAQLARAVGIHLVVATQRPSVDVITGLIKANFPTRISFAVTSQVDSRTVLDMVGAEKLLGHGDMLFAPPDAAKPKRLQGCYVSDPEVERLVYFWNSQKVEGVPQVTMEDIMAVGAAKKEGPGEDPLMETVRKLAADHNQQLSASFLQRKLNIGYPRAARLFDRFKEEMGPNGDGGAEMSADTDEETDDN